LLTHRPALSVLSSVASNAKMKQLKYIRSFCTIIYCCSRK